MPSHVLPGERVAAPNHRLPKYAPSHPHLETRAVWPLLPPALAQRKEDWVSRELSFFNLLSQKGRYISLGYSWTVHVYLWKQNEASQTETYLPILKTAWGMESDRFLSDSKLANLPLRSNWRINAVHLCLLCTAEGKHRALPVGLLLLLFFGQTDDACLLEMELLHIPPPVCSKTRSIQRCSL